MKKIIICFSPVILFSLIGCNPSVQEGTLTVDQSEVTIKSNQNIRLTYHTTNGQVAEASSTNSNIIMPYKHSDYSKYNNYIYLYNLGLNPGTCYVNISAKGTNTVKVKITVEKEGALKLSASSSTQIYEAAHLLDEAVVNKLANVAVPEIKGINKGEEYLISNYMELGNSPFEMTASGYADDKGITYYVYVFSYYDFSTSFHDTDVSYKNLVDGNFYIENKKRKKGNRSKLPIDEDSVPTYSKVKVSNSEQLWWLVEHGYRPSFESTSSNAYKCYTAARDFCLKYIDDDMSSYQKMKVFFQYLTGGIPDYNMQYNYWAGGGGMEANDDWCKYSDFFLEGPLLHNLGVCDAFSKTFALLCGIEQINNKSETLETNNGIRCFGFTNDNTGHAWNYTSLDSSNYYLVCPTWGRQTIDGGEEKGIDENIAYVDYSAFFASSKFFVNRSGKEEYSFSDFAWIEKSKSKTRYTSEKPTGYYFENDKDFSSVINPLKEISNSFCVSINVSYKDIGSGFTKDLKEAIKPKTLNSYYYEVEGLKYVFAIVIK